MGNALSDMNSAMLAAPPWLQRSRSQNYVKAVLQVLAMRENVRYSARHSSRNQITTYQDQNSPTSPNHIEQYSVSLANKYDNRYFNRYLDIEPYDRTIVHFGSGDENNALGGGGNEGGRYINGNWVRELLGGKWWIATQAPLPVTTHAFLSLIMQPVSRPPRSLLPPTVSQRAHSQIRTVVQLTQIHEGGRQKAHPYFPTQRGESFIVSPEPGYPALQIKVTLCDSVQITSASCVKSLLSISPVPSSPDDVEPEEVLFHHLLYESWPDHGVPDAEHRAGLLEFVRLVDQTNRDLSPFPNQDILDPDPPMIVGCSAGVGRTGAFITLSSLLRAHNFLGHSPASVTPSPLPTSPLGPLPENLANDLVLQEIDSLREQRPCMVQKDVQVLLIYEVLAQAFKDAPR